MTYLDDIIEAIEKGNKEKYMTRANHYYLKAIAISLREILKTYKKNGVIPNFIVINDPTQLSENLVDSQSDSATNSKEKRR